MEESHEITTESDKTLVGLLRGARHAKSIPIASGLLIISWLGTNAIWGMTGSSDTLVSGLERRILPPVAWLAGAFAILLGASLVARLRKDRHFLGLALVLLAYLAGVLLSRYLTTSVELPAAASPPVATDALWLTVRRIFLLVTALPMLAVLLALPDWRISELPLRFGDWRLKTRFFGDEATDKSWFKHLGIWLLAAALPIAILMQATVDFEPILSGKVWPFLPPLLLLAALNAFSEELLFRGLFQPVLIRFLGVGAAIWIQAAFFGIHHLGASPSAISGLPTALVIGFMGLVWGKSTYETGGLGWAVCLHTALDISFFSAHFVPTN